MIAGAMAFVRVRHKQKIKKILISSSSSDNSGTVPQLPAWYRPKTLIAAILVLPALNVLYFYHTHHGKPFVHPRFKAAAYVWPVGCPRANYTRNYSRDIETIPFACADKKYLFDDKVAMSYGLSWFFDENDHYYRVENSLLSLRCFYHAGSKENKCDVNEDINDVYYQ